MTSRWLLAAPVLALSTLIAADQVSEKWTKRLDVAEAVYQTTVAKAENLKFNSVQKANKPYWIGVSNETDVMQWAWVTGQAAVVDSSWKVDDPNPPHFSVGICYWPESSSFNDHNLGAQIGFVCEWEE